MRIVLDVRTISDHFPGIGRYTYHLAAALRACLGDNELVLLHNPAQENTRYDVAALAEAPGVRLAETAARPFGANEQLRLPGQVRGLAPGVSHYPYYILPYLAPRPQVVTIHDVIPLRFPQYFGLRQRILYRLTTMLALASAARVICVSTATRDDVLARFRVRPDKVIVVPEGVAPQFRPCAPDEVARVRARYGLPERYVLYLGINKPHKNLPLLIDAYARLENPPPLVLAGREDPRYPQARQRAELLGLRERVLFPEAIADEDLPGVYSGALVFAFVSLYEGFGLPPLEAMACGVPVVCSTTPALQEVAGEAAVSVDPGDRDAVAGALERVLADDALRTDLRARGLARAAEFTWDRAAVDTMMVYDQAKG